ncbi:MAG: hypothetical protein IJV27_02330 [Prevotella sp.]|nr:hypothetical protein [Prevotella sp.]
MLLGFRRKCDCVAWKQRQKHKGATLALAGVAPCLFMKHEMKMNEAFLKAKFEEKRKQIIDNAAQIGELQADDLLVFSPRELRMKLFTVLYEHCEAIRNDDRSACRLFQYAYQNTNNIHAQLKETGFQLKEFLRRMAANVRPEEVMSEEKRELFDAVPETLTVYRGLSEAEKASGDLGVSWTSDARYAARYLWLPENQVGDDFGWVAEMEISKADVVLFTYEVHDEPQPDGSEVATKFNEFILIPTAQPTFHCVRLRPPSAADDSPSEAGDGQTGGQ